MNLKQLEKKIKEKNLSPVYYFTGPERNIIRKAVEIFKRELLSPATSVFNFKSFSDPETDFSQVFMDAQTLPVMSEYRIIQIGEEVKISTQDEKVLKHLEGYIAQPSASTVLIIQEEKPDKRRKIFQLLKRKVEMIDFPKLKLPELRSWILDGVSAAGKQIDQDALEFLIVRSQYLTSEKTDTQVIDNYLEQLLSFSADSEKITEKDVREVVPEGIEENVFKIIDLAVSGKLSGIEELLDGLLESGENAIGLLALLMYQIRNITRLKQLLGKRISQQRLAKELGLSPFVVKKLLPVASAFSLERCYEIISDAADLDFEMKTGMQNPDFGLKHFILKLSRK